MSQPIPEQSNFVAIGAWNPAILQPQWLKKHFPKHIPDNCRIEIASSGNASAIRMNYDRVVIDPNNGRLVLMPKVLDEDTMGYISELAKGIYELLEHTPVGAAGCNFVYKLESGESFTVDDIEKDDKIVELYNGLGERGELVSKSIRHTFSLPDCSINVNYDYIGADRILRMNFDYQKTKAVENAANALVGNYKYSQELVGKLVRKKGNV